MPPFLSVANVVNTHSTRGATGAPSIYYTLNGSTSYISSDFDPSAISTGNISISCWIRVDTVPSGTEYVWILGNDNLDDSLALRVASSKLEAFGRVGTSGEVTVTAANPIVPDLWTHVVVTRTGTTIELFLNGTANASGTNAEAAANLSDGETWIGYHIGSPSFAGDFANFEIRNAVLTDSEIYDNFNAGTAYTTGTEQTQTLTPTNTTTTNSSLPASWNNRWAFYFDGVNDGLEADGLVSQIISDTTGTFSFWVSPFDAQPGSSEALFCISDQDSNTYFFARIDTSGRVYVRFRIGGTTQWELNTTNPAFSSVTWSRVDIVQDGTEPEIFINGATVAQSFNVSTDKTLWLSDLTNQDIFRIGYLRQSGSSSNYFHGLIDEFHYTSDALTSGQIATQYNAGTPADPRSLSLDGYIHEATGADWSGNNHLATLQSGAEITANVPVVTLPDWENSHSLDFNGTTAQVVVAHDSSLNLAGISYTLSCWFKTDGSVTSQQELITKRFNGTALSGFELRFDSSGRIEFIALTDGSNILKKNTNSSFDDSAWHFVTAVVTTSDVTIYVDAALQAVTDASTGTYTGTTNNSDDLKIGSRDASFFSGQIAHPAIHTAALDAAAITKLAGEPIDLTQDDGNYDNSSDLVAYWPFISGAGAGALDHSGNSNHGVIIDATWTTDTAS